MTETETTLSPDSSIATPQISVVVPVYNGSEFLPELCQRLCKVLESMEADYEVLLVDDSSQDDSYAVSLEMASRYKGICAMALAKNCGQQIATLVGLSRARGEIVVTIDDDLQNPPEEIPALVNPLISTGTLDVTIAKYDSKKHSLIRNIGTKVLDHISNYTVGKPKSLHLTSFRAMRRFIAQSISATYETHPRVGYLILGATSHVINVQVHHEVRMAGSSGYNVISLAHDFLKILSDSSNIMLDIVHILRVLVAAIWGGALVYLINTASTMGDGVATLFVLITAILQLLNCLGERILQEHADDNTRLTEPVVDTVAIRSEFNHGKRGVLK